MTDQFAAASRRYGPRASFDRVIEALRSGGSRVGPGNNSVKAQCPVPSHEDRSPSLSVTWRDSGGSGLTLLNCHGCGAPAIDIADALGLTLADLYDEPMPKSVTNRTGRAPLQVRGGKRRSRLGRLPAPLVKVAADSDDDVAHEWVVTTRYEYVDESGSPVQLVVRETCPGGHGGGEHKRFQQQFYGAKGNLVFRKPASFVPVPYRVPEVLAGIAAGNPVYVFEGE